jgi:MFS family permease
LLVPIFGWRAVMIASSGTALLAFFMRRSLHLPASASEHRPTLASLARARIGGRLAIAWILGVFKLGTYWTCYTWLPSFLRDQMHQSIARSTTWVLTAQVGQLTGMLTFGVVSDRIGRRPAFAIYSLLTALAIAPLAYRWPWLSDHPPIFWTTMLMLGIGSGCTAGFGALLAELFPTQVRSTAMGTTYNLARSAQIGAPLIVAWAVHRWQIAGGLSVPLVLAIATASWVWLLPETKGIDLPEISSSSTS